LPDALNDIPRPLLIGIIPVAVFLIAAAIAFGSGGGDDDGGQAAAPSVTPTRQVVTAAQSPTAVATPRPTATVLPDRTSCSDIRGTDYRSEAERTWFNQNCSGTAAASGGSSGSSGGGSSSPSGGSSNSAGAGPAIAAGTEYPLGDRLIIPAAGVNASVSGIKVGSNGVMPDPVGYFNAVWYDFSALGLGGYVTGGNLVVAGHVDCARCNGGGPGTAVFYNTRYLQVGDTIQYVTAGGVTKNYVVFSNVDYSASTDFAGVVSPGAADITIITCTGTFSGGHYNNRNVVFGRLI
jgi:hypothetical protein